MNMSNVSSAFIEVSNTTTDSDIHYILNELDTETTTHSGVYFTFTDFDTETIKVCFGAAGVLGVILNLLTIFSIGFGKNINKAVKIQLINLAVADLITAAFLPYSLIIHILQINFAGDIVWCAIYKFITLSAFHACLLCSAAISLERLVVIYFPFRASQYGKKQKYIVVVIIWLCATLPEIHSAITADLIQYYDQNYCLPAHTLEFYQYYWIVSAKNLISAIIIVVSYSLVFIKLCKRKKSKMIQQSSNLADRDSTDKLQLMLVVDVFLTLVTWLPYNLYNSIRTSLPPTYTYYRGDFALLTCLAPLQLTNLFSTPIVYFIFNRYFRMDVRLLFHRMFGITQSPAKTPQKIRCQHLPTSAASPPSKQSAGIQGRPDEIKSSAYSRSESNAGTVDTFASNAVNCTTISDNAVNYTTMSDNAVNCTTMLDNAVDCTTMSDNAVNCTTMSDNTVNCTTMSDNTVNCTTISDNAVNCTTMSDNAVTCTTMSNNAVNCTTMSDTL